MALTVISNFAANVAHRHLVDTEKGASTSLAKLSSGQRIVSAKDDAASLAIGSRLAAEVGAMRQASVNGGQAASLLQIADGSLARANDILTRMKTLAVQASSGQLGSTERSILNTEYQALKNEIIRIGNDTEFNGVKLLAGSQSVTLGAAYTKTAGFDAARAQGLPTGNGGSLQYTLNTTTSIGTFTFNDGTNTYTNTINYGDTTVADTNGNLVKPLSITLTSSNAQVKGTLTLDLSTAFDANAALANQAATVTGSSTTTFTFKVGTGAVATEDDLTFSVDSLVSIGNTLATDITTQTNADTASAQVTSAIDTLSNARATVGANQSRLDFAIANVATAVENSEAARSQLLDLDVAAEMTVFTSKQILLQTGVSMLAQANQIPQALLRLFQ